MGTTFGGLMASIPSPPSNRLHLGPLDLSAYGAMLALGALAAVWLARRRWAAHGGNPDQISRIALVAVPAGLIGSRLYHVITDWRRFHAGNWTDAFHLWEGGLGIPGGMAAGLLVGVWVAERQRMGRKEALSAVVPALPLGQAVGRLGNWFNQELFGSPTGLPWGLEIEQARRPAQYLDVETFHPTFLYEAAWNLLLCAVLVHLDRRWKRRSVPKPAEHPARREPPMFTPRCVRRWLRSGSSMG